MPSAGHARHGGLCLVGQSASLLEASTSRYPGTERGRILHFRSNEGRPKFRREIEPDETDFDLRLNFYIYRVVSHAYPQ